MTKEEIESICQWVIEESTRAGATASDVMVGIQEEGGVSVRQGEVETRSFSKSLECGLRVFLDQRQAVVATSNLEKENLKRLIREAITRAKILPADPYGGLADPAQVGKEFQSLETWDDTTWAPEFLEAQAHALEAAAMGVPGVTLSDSANVETNRNWAAMAASNGFLGTRKDTHFSLSVSVIAGEDSNMETDYDWDSASFASDLRSPEEIGRKAGENAVERLNPRKIASAKMPIIFDPKVGKTLLSCLAGAINGRSIALGTSFLKDALGTQIFPKEITIWDDPFLRRGPRSAAFDVEGLIPQKRAVVKDGILQNWILDLSTGRQLGLPSTANASRGPTSLPSPSVYNFYPTPGTLSVEALLKETQTGLYITDLLGHGANLVTGDFSVGVVGFMIEKGILTFPVAEITIAGHLRDMFAHLTLANDLSHRYGIDVPTLRIEEMTVAGV